MDIKNIKTYEDLEQYLNNFKNFGNSPGVYDFNGVVHLMLALLDNLHANGLESELEDIGDSMTDEQRTLWIQIGKYITE